MEVMAMASRPRAANDGSRYNYPEIPLCLKLSLSSLSFPGLPSFFQLHIVSFLSECQSHSLLCSHPSFCSSKQTKSSQITTIAISY
ncbi:hypothetical protein VTL71DRAFT_6355 [Oculimacula yallundae]|uniref:Uncharacterized protein n=1 Tax=Oculimacula yallundae TaxID=86028 RepID=A0ABR4BYF4_9HELO